jgi:hypothetical protein
MRAHLCASRFRDARNVNRSKLRVVTAVRTTGRIAENDIIVIYSRIRRERTEKRWRKQPDSVYNLPASSANDEN